MNGVVLTRSLAVLALLCSSAANAATVAVNLSENSGIANDGLVNVGDSFSLTVSGADFPQTIGATLRLLFNEAAVGVIQPTLGSGIVLAPGSPFTDGVIVNFPDPFPSGRLFTVLVPPDVFFSGNYPSGDFDAFVINFTALAAGPANVVIFDDQFDLVWVEAVSLRTIPVTYTQADVSVIPVPAAAWLFGSALGLLGAARRRASHRCCAAS